MTLLFHEMFGCYFKIAAKLLKLAKSEGALPASDIRREAEEMGYAETASRLPEILARGWRGDASPDSLDGRSEAPALFFKDTDENYITLVSPATRPLSLLERRWIATILRDPRMRLFLDDYEIRTAGDMLVGSSGTAPHPLWNEEDYCRFDEEKDADDYADPEFRDAFRTALSAIRARRALEIEYLGYSGIWRRKIVRPLMIEYSLKSDLFRLIFEDSYKGQLSVRPIRIRRIKRATIMEDAEQNDEVQALAEALLSIVDEEGALERAHSRFANYKVYAVGVSKNERRLLISYPKYEENGLIEAILSFGGAIKALEPAPFVKKIRGKVAIQTALLRASRG